MESVASCECRASLRILWICLEWLANLFFILNVEAMSNDRYSSRLIRQSQLRLLMILYIIIFALKSIYWFYSFYHVIYAHGILSVKSRVLALWLLSISSGVLCIAMSKTSQIRSHPFYFTIVIIHIGIICKQCFVLGSFPFNIFFQYVLALLFATDFALMLPLTNILEYDDDDKTDTIDYIKFVVFIMCCLFMALICFRPISILCEGKYPKFVKPVYRDYYDSEDGGWRNDGGMSQIEETAISAYKTQLFSVPDTSKQKQIDHDVYESEEEFEEEFDTDGTDMAHSLINMVSHDIILPTTEPSQFDKCYYWNLSLLFIFFIHIPIIILMSTKTFSSFLIVIPTNDSNNGSEIHIGIVIYIFFILPTLYILGIVLLLLIFRIFEIKKCCVCLCDTHALFWCLFSKQYFDIIAIHRGHNEQNKEEYYSSLWSFKKRMKHSSESMMDGIVEKKKGKVAKSHSHSRNGENSVSNKPKAPPKIDNAISSLKDSLILKENGIDEVFGKKSKKKKKKKNRNESINRDQELTKLQTRKINYRTLK